MIYNWQPVRYELSELLRVWIVMSGKTIRRLHFTQVSLSYLTLLPPLRIAVLKLRFHFMYNGSPTRSEESTVTIRRPGSSGAKRTHSCQSDLTI